jgi:chromosome segregation ATPase
MTSGRAAGSERCAWPEWAGGCSQPAAISHGGAPAVYCADPNHTPQKARDARVRYARSLTGRVRSGLEGLQDLPPEDGVAGSAALLARTLDPLTEAWAVTLEVLGVAQQSLEAAQDDAAVAQRVAAAQSEAAARTAEASAARADAALARTERDSASAARQVAEREVDRLREELLSAQTGAMRARLLVDAERLSSVRQHEEAERQAAEWASERTGLEAALANQAARATAAAEKARAAEERTRAAERIAIAEQGRAATEAARTERAERAAQEAREDRVRMEASRDQAVAIAERERERADQAERERREMEERLRDEHDARAAEARATTSEPAGPQRGRRPPE